MAVSCQGDEDDLLFARLTAPSCLFNGGLYGVSRLRGGNYAFRAGEECGRFKDLVLLQGNGLDQAVVNQVAE